MNEDYLMISFENTHSAIQTERLLEQHFKVATMPTLRTVTQSCGISLRLAAEDYEPARKIVAESGLSPVNRIGVLRILADYGEAFTPSCFAPCSHPGAGRFSKGLGSKEIRFE